MRKDKGFFTIEQTTNISSITVDKKGVYLLECLTNLLANEMFDPNGTKDLAKEKIINDIEILSTKAEMLVIVTNEVNRDGNVYDIYTNKYIENLCQINNYVANIADIVIECVAGIPLYLKGEKYEAI